MLEKVTEAKEKLLQKKTKTSVFIASGISLAVITVAVFVTFFGDDIQDAQRRRELKKSDTGWSDENLGEISEDENETAPIEIVEYVTDNNGLYYAMQNLGMMSYQIPIPVDSENWKVSYEAEKVYIVNTDYNGQYGNIEYGMFPVDKNKYFSTIFDVQNTVFPKASLSLQYHGFNSVFTSCSMQDTAPVQTDTGSLVITPTQRFKENQAMMDTYITYYSRYYIVKAADNEYYILYGIAPSNKEQYLNNILEMAEGKIRKYVPASRSVSYYPPAIYDSLTIGNTNVGMPQNLENIGYSVYQTNDIITSPLAGTYFCTISRIAEEEPELSDFTNTLQMMFGQICGRTDALMTIQSEVSVSNDYTDKLSENLWLCKGHFIYSSPEIIEIAPFGNQTRIMAYIMQTGSQQTMIAASYTETNEKFVKQYLYNIVQHSQAE